MLKNYRFPIITLALITSLILSMFTGCNLSINSEYFTDDTEKETSAEAEIGLDVVQQAWEIIFDEYVDKDKLDADKLSQAAIEGMLEALDDPYSSYMDTPTYQASVESYQGSYEGIGAYVGMRDEQIVIIAPFPDSPADRAGIKPGDILLEINGDSAIGISITEAVILIKGPKGTPVSLLILHEDETEPVEIEVIRDKIDMASVMFRMMEDIAYIGIIQFTERTSEEMTPVMEKMVQEEATAIILDLRSNPGGLLDSVVDVASRFINEGVVLKVVDNEGNKTVHHVNSGIENTGLPMVVLTDNYTASASEVLAGALQDYDRAVIAGTITYGKGSVNLIHTLKDNSGLILTYARWFTPDDHLIEGEGIIPDYEFDLKGEDAIQWAIDYLKENRD
ncbi:S41 family peptidase [Chloroflexota bacterium]